MKADAPDDLQGRIIRSQQVATLLHEVLDRSEDSDSGPLSPEALIGLGILAGELADELHVIEDAYVKEVNRLYDQTPRGRKLKKALERKGVQR